MYKSMTKGAIAAIITTTTLFDSAAPSQAAQTIQKVQQIITVTGSYGSHNATVRTYIKKDGKLYPVYKPMQAVVGYHGIAPLGHKREGDGRTPSGTYTIGFEFGYAPSFKTRMPYRQATANDYWVEDVHSPQYNEWVHGKPNAKSYEVMRRRDNLYRYGATINYNPKRIPGLGSAIFLHEWRTAYKATAGCIALSEPNLITVLQWLDPKDNPIIIIGTSSYVSQTLHELK
jgi:L,D-peptidoglycan transpeptidase YkuD (ErfK/YbiS/YcfS/YnhG family)